MATYAVSDVHGEYKTFLSLLERIGFSSQDTLFVIGDVFDRGKDGVKLLQYIRKSSNIHFLLGNHEYMALQFFSPFVTEVQRRRWNRNGNFYSLAGFDSLSTEEKEEILRFLEVCPTEAKLHVNGRDFLLVHGFLGETREDQVWNRPEKDTMPELPENTTLVVGHTPVAEFVCPGSEEDLYVYSRQLTEKGDHFRIFHAPGFVDIDCCVGYGLSAARLACLRLDDGKEFYEKVVD